MRDESDHAEKERRTLESMRLGRRGRGGSMEKRSVGVHIRLGKQLLGVDRWV